MGLTPEIPPETIKEQAQELSPKIEAAQANPETQAKNTEAQNPTPAERRIVLNDIIVAAQREALELKQEVDQKLKGLDDKLSKTKLLAKSVSTAVTSTIEKSIVGPWSTVSEFMKGIGAGIAESSIGKWVERTFYSMLAPVDNIQEKFLGLIPIGTLLKPVGRFAKRNLRKIEMQDAIASAKDPNKPEEMLSVKVPTDPELERFERWSKEKAKTSGSEPSILVLADEYIASMRKNSPNKPITLSLTAFMDRDKPKAEREAEQNELRKKGIMESWGTNAIADVRFEAGKTSLENGILTVPASDLLEDGTAKPNTPVKFLKRSIPELGAAQSITMVPSGEHRIQWTDGKKAITVAMNQGVPLRILNELLAHPPSRISEIRIGRNDRISDKSISFTYEGSHGVLTANPNETLLTVLSQSIGNLDFSGMNEKGRTWDFSGTTFVTQEKLPVA